MQQPTLVPGAMQQPTLMPGAIQQPTLMPGAIQQPTLMSGAIQQPIDPQQYAAQQQSAQQQSAQAHQCAAQAHQCAALAQQCAALAQQCAALAQQPAAQQPAAQAKQYAAQAKQCAANALLIFQALLTARLGGMQFTDSKAEEIIKYIYNPLIYAINPHTDYVNKYFGLKKVLFVGMNPGPYGMAQNGVPFGDGDYVRDYMRIQGDLVRPFPTQHHIHPILGLDCMRREESGTRFWGFMMKVFGNMDNFFRHAYVHNYCPLLFLDENGTNVTPDKLATSNNRRKLEGLRDDRKELVKFCDEALLSCINIMQPKTVVAMGRYVEIRVNKVLKNAGIDVVYMTHPSPATGKNYDTFQTEVSWQLVNVLPCMKQPPYYQML